jgi:hypothetical protein
MHAPKPDEQRRRRNAPAHGETVVTRDGTVHGEPLSDLSPGVNWSPSVVAWYERWRRMPQAALFEATDWGRLAMLAPIVEAYYRRPSAAALGEIRMSEERLGATIVDRLRARIRIDADEAEAAPVLSLVKTRDALRRRLTE